MLITFVENYKYILLFFGLVFGGETALFAGIYFAAIGVMNFQLVVIIAFAASIFADVVWYWVGSVFSYKALKKFPIIRSQAHHITSLENFLEKHALRALFYSKFVYGTRIVVQILCGTHRIDLKKYFGINLLGHVVIILAIVALGQTVSSNIDKLKQVAHGVEIGFTVLGLLLILIHVLIKRFATKALQ